MRVPQTVHRLVKVALALVWLGLAGLASADTPTVRLVVGFPPGGGTDAIARLLAEKLQEPLGVNVIVENKAGAGGQLAAQALKAAPADGSVLFLSHDHTLSILPLVLKDPGYSTSIDFAPVAGFATFVNALAVADGTPVSSFQDYVAWVRSKGKDTVAVPAPASVPEFLVKLIAQKYLIELQAVPYRGSAPMVADMQGKQIAAGVASVPDFIDHHRAGKVRILALTGDQRQAILPDVPTFSELGLSGFEELPYYGIFAPAGTPKVLIERYSEAVARVISQPEVRERLSKLGLTVGHMGAQQLGAREKAYSDVWRRIILVSGFQPQ